MSPAIDSSSDSSDSNEDQVQRISINHDPAVIPLTLDALYKTAENAISHWDVTRYRNGKFLLYYPEEEDGHKDRRPHWWLSEVKVPLPYSHWLCCLNNVPQPTGERDEEACWKEFVDVMIPIHGDRRTGDQLKEYERISKLRADHQNWPILDLVLVHLVNALTLKTKGRPTGPPSSTPIEIFHGRQVNTAEDMRLRVSDNFPHIKHLFEKSQVRLFSSLFL